MHWLDRVRVTKCAGQLERDVSSQAVAEQSKRLAKIGKHGIGNRFYQRQQAGGQWLAHPFAAAGQASQPELAPRRQLILPGAEDLHAATGVWEA